MTILGFTGTQHGMTKPQTFKVMEFISQPMVREAHHGDCIGADFEFHQLCRFKCLYIVGHPPINESKRAFCDFNYEWQPKEYLDRNHDIVDSSTFMIAAPGEMQEIKRSGTWATIRYTQKQIKAGRPLTMVIVYPDGTYEWH